MNGLGIMSDGFLGGASSATITVIISGIETEVTIESSDIQVDVAIIPSDIDIEVEVC